jgi:hypothetical protein
MELVLVTNKALLLLIVADSRCRNQNRSETNSVKRGDYIPVRLNNSEIVGLCEDREHCGG